MSGIVIEVEAKVSQAETSLERLNDVVRNITASLKAVDKGLENLSLKKEVPLDKTEKALNNLSPKIDKLQSSTDKLFKGSSNVDNRYSKEFVNIGVSAEMAGKRVEKAFNDITLKPNDAALKSFSFEIDRTSRKISKQMSEGISKKDLRDTESSLLNINKSITGISGNITSAVGSIGTAIAAFGSIATIGMFVKSLSDITSSFTEIESKIAMVTGRTVAFSEAQQALLKVAAETRTTYGATADAFSGVGRAMKDVGATSEQLFRVTKVLQQSQALSGGSSEGFKAAMMQLNQGLSSGALRGEELNSVLEQAPAIADALARSLHVSVGALKGIAEQGKLTTSVVFSSLLKQADYINDKFKAINPTLGNAMEAGFEGAKRFAFELDKGLGLSQDLAKAVSKLTSGLGTKTSGIRVFAADFDVQLKEAIIRVKSYMQPLTQVVTALGQEFYRVFSSWKIPEGSQKPLDDLIRKFTIFKFVLTHTDPGTDTKILFRKVETAIVDSVKTISDLLDKGIKLSDKFIMPIIDKIKDLYPKARKALLTTLDGLRSVIKESMSVLADGFEIGAEFVKPIIRELTKLPDQLILIFNKVAKALGSAASATSSLADGVADLLDSVTLKVGDLDGIYEYLNSFKDKVITIFFKIWDAVIGHSWWTDTIDSIIDTSKSLWEKASPGLIRFRDSIIALFKTIASTVTTAFNDAMVKLNIEPKSVSFKIPISIDDAKVQFEGVYDSFVKTFDKFKDDFPLLFKAIAAGVGAILVGMFLPSGNFVLLLEAALISASIQSATMFAETIGRDLGDASLLAGLGNNLGAAAGKLFASFLANMPLLVSAFLGFISEFTKEFLKQLPIIGVAFKALFGIAGAFGMAGPLGLVGAIFFGRGILGIMATFGFYTEAITGFMAKMAILGNFFGGGGGLISRLLFGAGRAWHFLPILGLIASLSGAFDALYNDSSLSALIINGGLIYFAIFGKGGLAGFAKIGMLVRANIVGILSEFTATAGLASSIAAGGAFGPMLMAGIRNFRNFFRGVSAMSAMFFSSSLSSWAQYFTRWIAVTGFSGNILRFFRTFYLNIFGPITAASYSFAPLAQSFVAAISAMKAAAVSFIMTARTAGIAMGGWLAALTRMLLGGPGILILVGLIASLFSKSADAAESFREESNKGFFENLTDNIANLDIIGYFRGLKDKLDAIDFGGMLGVNFKVSIYAALTAVTAALMLFSTNVRKTLMLLAGDLLVFSGKALFSIAALFSPVEVLAAGALLLKAGWWAGVNLNRGLTMGFALKDTIISIIMRLQATAALAGAMRTLGITMAVGLLGAFSAEAIGFADFSAMSVLGFTAIAAFIYPILNGLTVIPAAITAAFTGGTIMQAIGVLSARILLMFAPLGLAAAGAFAGAWAGGQFGDDMAMIGGLAGALLAFKFTESIMTGITEFLAVGARLMTLGWVGLALTAAGLIYAWLFGSDSTSLSQDLDSIIEKTRTLFGMKPNPVDFRTGLRLDDLQAAATMGIKIDYKIDPISAALASDSSKEAVTKATEDLAQAIRDAKADWDISGLTQDQRDLLQKKVKATAARVDAASASTPFVFKDFGKNLTQAQRYRPDTLWGQLQRQGAQAALDAEFEVKLKQLSIASRMPWNQTSAARLDLKSQRDAVSLSKDTTYNANYSPLDAETAKLAQLTKGFDNLGPVGPKMMAHLKDTGREIIALTKQINENKYWFWEHPNGKIWENAAPDPKLIAQMKMLRAEYKSTAEDIVRYSTLMKAAQSFAGRISSIASKFDMKGVESKLDTNKIFANSDTAVNRMEKLGEAAERLSKSLEGVFDVKAKNDIILNIEEVVKQKERLKEDSVQSYKYASPVIPKMAEELGLGAGKAAAGLPENISGPVLARMTELKRQREDFLNKPVRPVNPDLVPQDFVKETAQNKHETMVYQGDMRLWQTRKKNQETVIKTLEEEFANNKLGSTQAALIQAKREATKIQMEEPVKPALAMLDAKAQQAKMEKLRIEYKQKLEIYKNDNFEYFDKYMKNLVESFDLGDELRKELWSNVKTKPGQMADVANKLNIDIGDLYSTFGADVAAGLLQQADDVAAAIDRAMATQQYDKLPALKQRKAALTTRMATPEFKSRGAMAESMGLDQSLIPGISTDVLDSLEAGYKKIKEIDTYLEMNKNTISDATYQAKIQEKLNEQLSGKKAALDASFGRPSFELQARIGTNLTGAQLSLISQTDVDNLKAAELNLAKIKLDLDGSNANADTLTDYFKALADEAEARYQASRNAASKTGAGMMQSLADVNFSGASKLNLLPPAIVQNVIKLSNYIKDLRHNLEQPTSPEAFIAINKEIAKTEEALSSIRDQYTSLQDKISSVNEVFGVSFSNIDFVSLGSSLTSTLITVAQSLKTELAKEMEKGFLSVRAESIIKVLDSLTTTGTYLKFFADFKKNARESLTDGMKSAFDKIKSIAPNFGFSQNQFQMMDKGSRDQYSKQASDITALTAIQGLNGLTQNQTDIINQKQPVDEMMKQLIDSFDTNQLKQYEKLTSSPVDLQLKAADIQLEAAKMNLEAVKGKAPEVTTPFKEASKQTTERALATGPRSGVTSLAEMAKDIPWSANAPKPKFRPDVERWDSLIQDAVKEFPRVTVEMVKAVVEHESRGLNIKSGITPKPGYKETSFGLGQFNDATAKTFGVDKTDPASTIRGIAQYLSLNMKTFGNTRDAFRAYAVGPTGAKQGLGQDKADEFMTTLATGRAPKSAPVTTSPELIKPTAESVAKSIEVAVSKQGELSRAFNVDLMARIKEIGKQKPFEAYQLDKLQNQINPNVSTPAELLSTHGAKLGTDIVGQMNETQISLATSLNEKLMQVQQQFNANPSTALQQSITTYSEMLKAFTEGVTADAEELGIAKMVAFSSANSTNISKFLSRFSGISEELVMTMNEADKALAKNMTIIREDLKDKLAADAKAGKSTTATALKILDLSDNISDLGNKAMDAAKEIKTAGESFASGFTSSFKDAFKGLMNQDKADGKSVIGTFGNKLKTSIKDQVLNTVADSFTNVLELGKGGKLTKVLQNVGKNLFSTIGSAGSGIKKILSGNMTMEGFTSGISDWWSGITGGDTTDTSNMSPEEIQLTAAEKFSKAVDKFANGGVGGGLGGIAKAAAGGGFLSGLGDTLMSALPWVAGGAGVLGLGALLSGSGKGSWNEGTKGLGGDFFSSFNGGKSSSGNPTSFLNPVTGIFETIREGGSSLLSGVGKAASGNWNADTFAGIRSGNMDKGTGVFDSVTNGLSSLLPGSQTGDISTKSITALGQSMQNSLPDAKVEGLWDILLSPLMFLFKLLKDGFLGIVGMFTGVGQGVGTSSGTGESSTSPSAGNTSKSPFSGMFGLAAGGQVKGPGTPTSDSIPALLSNGEFVVNAKATKDHRDLLEKINSGKVIKRSLGGMIGMGASLAGTFMKGKTGSLIGTLGSGISGIMGMIDKQQAAAASEKLLAAATHLESAATALESFAAKGGVGGGLQSAVQGEGQGGGGGGLLRGGIKSLMSQGSSGGIMDSIQGFFSNGLNAEHGTDALGGQSFGVLQSDANASVGSYGVLAADANSSINGAAAGNSFGVMASDANGGGMFDGLTSMFSEGGSLSNMFGGLTDGISGMFQGLVGGEGGGGIMSMFQGLVGGEGGGGIMSMFSGLIGGEGGGGIMGMFSGLFGGGGAGGALGGIGDIFGSLMSMLPFGFADGGSVRGPGSSTSDSIPAMLSNGEFVVNAASTREHRGLLEHLNSGKPLAKHYLGGLHLADGGIATAAAPIMTTPTASSAKPLRSNKDSTVVNLNITGDISRQTRAEVYKLIPNITQGVNTHNKDSNYKG
jgi:tape measure domain-containing protein